MLTPVWLGGAPKLMRPGTHTSLSVAFLFLGELFLIPHLLPIAAALARRANPPRIRFYVATSVHEEILVEALDTLRLRHIEIRRVCGFRRFPAGLRETPKLRSKVLVLALNAAAILRHDVAVVAERTSLWLPFVARRRGAAFVYNEHGAGPHANFRSQRNRFAARILMPGSGMAARVRESGHDDAPIVTVGYIKRDFIRDVSGSAGIPPFPQRRPTVVYVPHWMRAKSSWWEMGENVLEYFARSPDYNLIVAPHIRLAKFDPQLEDRLRPYRNCPNIHIDTGSFRLIDQSYINGADIYLGDGSSQVVEFAEAPRPVVFLNAHGIDWRSDPRFGHWQMGQVVADVTGLDRALAEASWAQATYAPIQRAYVERMMGHDDGAASERAAEVVCGVIAERRVRYAALA